MVDVPWPTSSNPGNAPGEGAGRLINCYAYVDNGSPRWKPSPGLTDFAAPPPGAPRGALYSLGLSIFVVGNKVVEVDSSGNVNELEEEVAGDGPVTIARNNNAQPDVVIVSSSGAYVINNGVIDQYPDANLPAVNSVSVLDGFFIFTTSGGQIWASDLNSTTINPLSFAAAEARPDGLLRSITYGSQSFLMGQESIEVWDDAGTIPFPLSRSSVITTGLIGQWAVAGFEDGWAGPLIFVAQDGSVRLLNGYTPTRISNDDLESRIAAVSDKSTLIASVYTFGGNAMWCLSSPDWTWEYNVTTSQWNERVSYQQNRWRGAVTLKTDGPWLVADQNGGKIYSLDTSTRTESTDPLIWGMDSGPIKQFPQRVQVPAAYYDFVLGQSVINHDPQAMLSWSHDGGARWANPVTRSVNKKGNFRGRVSVARMGLSSPAGIRLRFRVSDPAYSSFAGARMDANGRR